MARAVISCPWDAALGRPALPPDHPAEPGDLYLCHAERDGYAVVRYAPAGEVLVDVRTDAATLAGIATLPGVLVVEELE